MDMPQKKEIKYCVIDCRVSDPVQLVGESLKDQENIGRRFAEKNDWPVAHVFRKPHSATTTIRDDIDEVISLIKKDERNIRHYVFKSIDRLNRAGYSKYEELKDTFEKMGVQIWDTYGIIQPKRNTLDHIGGFKYKWSEYSPSQGAEMLANLQSQQEGRDILTRMIGAQISLVQNGYKVRRALDGYKNSSILVEGKKKIIQVPDPERAHYFIKMFQMRAEGLDDTSIVSHINALGYRTRVFHRWDRSDKEHPKIIGSMGAIPLTVKQLQRDIAKPEYAGIMVEKWTHYLPVRAQYEGLISIDLFNKANKGKVYIKEDAGGSLEVLYDHSPFGKVKQHRQKNNPEYPWKLLLCPHCKQPLLGSRSKGKSGEYYSAYHCGKAPKGKRAHGYLRVSKEELETVVKQYLESLRFDSDFLKVLEVALVKKYRERESEIVREAGMIGRNVAELKIEQAQKLNAFATATSDIVKNRLEESIETLEQQTQETQARRNETEITERGIKAFIRYAKYVMEHPAEILMNASDFHTRRVICGLIFEDVPDYFEILNGTPKLRPLFKLSSEFVSHKNQLVTLRGVEPRFYP